MLRKFRIVNAGNFLDFLEFSLFSSLLPLISRDLIDGNNTSQKALLAYLLFYIGFLGRPLGAFLFGFLGDLLGRRRALIFSLIGMSGSTLLLGLVPNCAYSHILIVLIRLIQGIFTGGEYANATVFVLETISPKMRFRNIGNLTAAGIFGASLGQLIGTIVLSESIPFIGWRSVFICVSLISMYVALKRTTHISDNTTPQERIDFTLIKEFIFSRYIVMGIIFSCIMNGLFYLIFTFIGTYSSIIKESFVLGSYLISFLSSFVMGGSLILWSRASILERYNSTQFIKFSLLIMIGLLYPMYSEISENHISLFSIILAMIFLAFMPLFALFAIKTIPENLPKHCRVLLSGLPESIGASLLGGASPFIASELITITGNKNAPAVYFIVLMVIAFLIVSFWPPKKTISE